MKIKKANVAKTKEINPISLAKTPLNARADIQVNPTPKQSINLNNIIELTEEHDTNRFNTQSIEQASVFLKKNTKRWYEKGYECIKYTLSCFWKSSQFSIIVKQQQILKTIEKLRNQKVKSKPILPPLSTSIKTLVLDIDQTLVYSSQNQIEGYDFSFKMPYKGVETQVYSKNRFGLESFLFEMSKIYEIIVYTTNIKEYVDHVVHHIDKKKRVSHVLYKQKCVNLNRVHYLKSLKVLGRDPNRVIFIDHNFASGILQPKNFLQIKPFTGQKHDRELVKLIPFLREVAENESVIPISSKFQQYFSRQIRLKYNSLEVERKDCEDVQRQKQNKYTKDSGRISKRKKIIHRKTNSQVEKLQQEEEKTKSNEEKSYEKSIQETESSLRGKDPNIQQSI